MNTKENFQKNFFVLSLVSDKTNEMCFQSYLENIKNHGLKTNKKITGIFVISVDNKTFNFAGKAADFLSRHEDIIVILTTAFNVEDIENEDDYKNALKKKNVKILEIPLSKNSLEQAILKCIT